VSPTRDRRPTEPASGTGKHGVSTWRRIVGYVDRSTISCPSWATSSVAPPPLVHRGLDDPTLHTLLANAAADLDHGLLWAKPAPRTGARLFPSARDPT
jgi:hypothetical protein